MLAFRRALLVLAASLLVLVAGCDEPSRADRIGVYLTDATGANPALGCGPGTLEVRVDQGPGEHRFASEALVSADGSFDLPLEIATYAAITRIQVGFDLESCDLLGAVPPFSLVHVGAVMVVTGERLSCADLDAPRLATGRTSAALVALGANQFIVGGTTRGVSTDRLIPVALPYLTLDDAIPNASANPLPELTHALRETRAARLGTSRMVIASSDRVFRFDTDLREGDREQPLEGVHEGAGGRSAVIGLGNEGVAIVGGEGVGGEGEGEGVASISWIDRTNDAVLVTPLATARRDPSVVVVGDALLIAGGQVEGEPLYELARFRRPGVAVAGSPTETREGAVLVSPDRRVALLLGGLAEDGTVRADTTLVTGCPDACRFAEGSAWQSPRLAPALASTARATWLVGGESADGVASSDVDVVRVVGDVVSVQALSGGLPTPRRAASAAELADGVITVFGGVDDEGTELGTFAVCWPSELDPLE